ncbi:hypothetical protein CcrC1_gp401 [Caulobacter phage C1]|nr:hypothetical protein CcrC1_gp401 [Caulobacter phage C1]UTU08630.1 hypothetical protein CcrC2_gp402 [Caulobacter phage C2]UTU09145.1 hypothetical protein CcrJ4_gp396 [Caulobacter phage J4]UTU10262.1 hypothetical protein CcrRB23_gp400 [Caulobacter phage RB23]WGN97296.1 hypothetical protein [Bertelyvirus sp.]
MTQPLKPLARDKYWIKLIATLAEFNKRFDHLEPDIFGEPAWMARPVGPKASQYEVWAREIYLKAYRLNRCAWAPRCDPLFPSPVMKGAITDPPVIGNLVYMSSIRPGNVMRAVGQLIMVDEERGPGALKLYDHRDGGPATRGERYTIKLLDGSIQRWVNAKPERIFDLNRYVGTIPEWGVPMSQEEAARLVPANWRQW